ncbi:MULTISPECIES: class I SAM-dependent DNA methyltransferase [unclassified Bradyrhizobium]|uniref:class I SAM-dependent DNA methyltransferase n=1 Tax=unclassified Bradyrhizobium TaxID=2631580 RepID=UPI0028EB3A7A|nr:MULTISPECIES: class I SAM-dependent DNA methyltransferase [unclassified Bradyrhizobium]
MARTPSKKKSSAEQAHQASDGVAFEAKLWAAADALRNNMDAAEYKHVVLGLIFLKYISDAFEAKHAELEAQRTDGADPEDPDEYRAENIFWVPPEARWSYLKGMAPQPTIGQLVDDAMTATERDNPILRGVLPKDFARPGLDKQRLGQIINLVSDIALGAPADRAKDTLGRVYEYFLSRFASAEGKSGGQFYTPSHVVRVLVEMLAPYKGRVYDPCCGSGGMFVQSENFIHAHASGNGNGGKARHDISIWGQESNYTTWRLAKMNLAIRGIEAHIAHGDTFHNDGHPDLKADYVLANPPFNDSDWRGDLLKDDKRWVYGVPPAGNANFAWVEHFIHHLAPTGLAGFVLANGSMSSNQSGEGEIRKAIVEADLVDCMVALPGQLFYSTQIPVCLWFLARSKSNGRFRDRRGETLFIDARKMGTMVDRVRRELTDADIARIAGTYHAWRGDKDAGTYEDAPGFCKSAKLEDIAKHGHVLTPGRYVGAAEAEEDDEPFEQKIARLATTLRDQQAEALKLDAAITANLRELGFGG